MKTERRNRKGEEGEDIRRANKPSLEVQSDGRLIKELVVSGSSSLGVDWKCLISF